MLMKFKINKHMIMDFIFITFGCFIASTGINLFLVNAELLSGGITGIALILQYLFNIPSGISIFVINIPLIFLSYKLLNRRFTIYTTIGMTASSLFLVFTNNIPDLFKIEDLLIYCIYGGVLCGLGYGLVFSRNGSTGGLDIVSMILRKRNSNLEIGKLGFTFNIFIILLAAIIFDPSKALYTLIFIYIQSTVLDKVINGFNSKKLLLILTDKEEEVIKYVIKDMNRGVTSLIAEGEYTHNLKKMLYVAVTSPQMVRLKRKILMIDPNAFITIIDVSEVSGKGFYGI
ncbi:YitT family protein [Caproiciproducens sp. MSJ-32]|uniref:YitT family protein n=1 Tax=Caproiciproducens sp. MSJ-32 TaxID=2841527 RepID=UPI001C103D07|nr:YitT family protein [Caproiciproducens sp. MSJ-32]MBU5455754.1 YitT family protein [Caproiciproducens sp. MSJ-32]